jgi:hypothetical protein
VSDALHEFDREHDLALAVEHYHWIAEPDAAMHDQIPVLTELTGALRNRDYPLDQLWNICEAEPRRFLQAVGARAERFGYVS